MRATVGFLLAFLGLPGAAATQSASGTALFAHAGPSAPIGELAHGWDPGYHLGGGASVPWGGARRLRFEVAYERLGVDASGRFEDFTGERPTEARALEGAHFSALTAMAGLEWRLMKLGGGATPYLTAGLGYALLTYAGGALLVDGERIVVEENRDSGLAGSVGMGVHVATLERFGVFSEARLVAGWPLDDEVHLSVPLRLGVSILP